MSQLGACVVSLLFTHWPGLNFPDNTNSLSTNRTIFLENLD